MLVHHVRNALVAMVGTAFSIMNTNAAAQTVSKQKATIVLDHGWQFRQGTTSPDPETGWMPATVPGDVHLDLLANKKIADPFYRDNESKLQSIQDENWEYRDTFDAAPSLLSRSNLDLVFDGLDGPSQVYVNGNLVLTGTNSFRVWRIPVKSHLHAGKNELRVVFASPVKAAAALAATDPWQPKTQTAPKTYLRKPAYQYGWDWGPTFVTSGIWRPVRLEAWDKARIADFAIRQHDVSREVAHIDAEVQIEASHNGLGTVTVRYAEGAKQPASSTLSVDLHAGLNTVTLPIEIRLPRLWYPAGYGDQPLYTFTSTISAGGPNSQATLDQREVKTGLRSIVLDRHPDQWGRSFQFVVNGIPVFAKGADVIPFDSFPNRVTTAEYRRILESARDANMNMIRHWGGGYYETDEFYQICDELGIMVWQDFMFGNDWQPATYNFKLNIEAEAEDQVRRLRNHPSIVLWCGNNETEGAMDWAPRPALAADVRYQMWQDYLTEFSGILPRVVARLEPEIPYWPSSPSADYEALSDHYQSGDAHIWDVWHGRVPFSTYETHHARFVTEYGFQSFPEMKTIEAFTEPADRTGIFTPVMLAHQKNNEGNSIIHDYLLKDYPEPKDFASFLYVSQVLQAEGIKIGAEHFRRSRPETMGSIFWQLNDCWPVASWSSIDYYGRWKALQYYARRFYAPVLVSPHVENGSVKVYVVSDKVDPIRAWLRVRLMDFKGKVLLEDRHAVEISPLMSKVYLDWNLKKLADAGGADTSSVFVVAELMDHEENPYSRNLVYLSPTKEIHLIPAQLNTEITGKNGNYKIHITSPVLARDVYLSLGAIDAKLSDNYFDILPGDSVAVTVTSNATLAELKAQLKIISLTDAFSAPSQPATVTAAH
ncbi:MAG: glycoside hydrolase family 2 protein [Terracidiphilus sp.]